MLVEAGEDRRRDELTQAWHTAAMTRARRLKRLAAYLPRQPGTDIEMSGPERVDLERRMSAFRARLQRRLRRRQGGDQ